MKASNSALRAPMILGPGRVGQSLATALTSGGFNPEVKGRDTDLSGLDGRVILLCVPDQVITPLADQIGAAGSRPALIGHTSGASTLEALAGAQAEASFSLHPLQTVPDATTDLNDCPAAVAGTSEAARDAAKSLAEAAGMKPFEVAESDRATYHAAASIASNYLITIEQTAAELLGGIAVENPREVLEPLVRRSLENWLDRGSDALTGPIARGDQATVESHRAALSMRRPELMDLYDALAEETRRIADDRDGRKG